MKSLRICLLLISIAVLITITRSTAQTSPAAYFGNHHYAFDPVSGFDAPAAVASRLQPYKVILLGQGGSHFLPAYDELRVPLLQFLHQQLQVNDIFLEFGSTAALLYNDYLTTGNLSLIKPVKMPSWQMCWEKLHDWRQTDKVPLHVYGIDFERPSPYLKALRTDFPELMTAIPELKALPDTLQQLACQDIAHINKVLQKSSSAKSAKDIWLRLIIENPGSCNDKMKNRNRNMYRQFLRIDSITKASRYFGELGNAHTVKSARNFSWQLDHAPGYENQVAVINTWCQGCTTEVEPVSNWQLAGIEKLIPLLMPWCTSKYTFFDFTSETDLPEVKKLRTSGEFLLIVRCDLPNH
ncbi:hypothetical protein [Chitinophaga sp. Cy-1792]|uniref:hypothetical protein n=1 Tax=Chitinophaga sp. Cy-1792 TaxID=2608339 RepID=UPI001421A5AA|nr:hypothetical protein [Chitinophaga sp. Cy-1792]NIG54264.1 hypothetical protein [Chitinophaga sp. Cy-1792]